MRALAFPVAAVLLLAGCAPADGPLPAATPDIPITHPHALLSCPDLPAEHLDAVPDDIVEVRRCTADFHEVQGVLNKVQYVRRLTSDPGLLLTAYTAPDAAERPDACEAMLHDPLLLWIELGSGEIVAVRAPVDGCGAPLPAASDALDAASFETVLVAREVASTLDDAAAR
jgi:hypothetical protein